MKNVVSEKITLSIKYYLLFYIAAGNLKEEQFKMLAGSTLHQLLEELSRKYGDEFSRRLWSVEGELLKTAWILKNGKRLNKSQLDIVVEEGDIFIITTPMLVGG